MLKKISPTSNKDKAFADDTVYKWNPEWCHDTFYEKPDDISSAIIETISVYKD